MGCALICPVRPCRNCDRYGSVQDRREPLLPRQILGWTVAIAVILGSAPLSAEPPSDPGRTLYLAKCASCHGDDGQGVAGTYEVPLAGARSVNELARLIEHTMPEGAPEECVGEDAVQVARFIYGDFYSAEARIRRGLDPVLQVERMRLTVPQYRNAVADVIGALTPSPEETRRRSSRRDGERRRRRGGGAASDREAGAEAEVAAQPGLRGLYFRSKGMSKADELAVEQIDLQIDFDFQDKAPRDDMPADQFALIWDGALWVPTTGEYLFRVTTPNGARLYLNNDPASGLGKLRDDSSSAGQTALIDAWVSSGKVREEQARVFLLGGRRYPLRLEFFKYMESSASIKLEWKPPHGVWSVLDAQYVSTAEVGRTYVVETPFPADDRSLGFERGKSVSHEWQVAVTRAAIAAAAEVVERLPVLAGDPPATAAAETVATAEPAAPGATTEPPTADAAAASASPEATPPTAEQLAAQAASAKRAHLQDFVVEFAEIAFRRPLAEEEQSRLRELPFENEPAPEAAVRRAIVWILCSPDFLYADLTPPDAPPSQSAIAARLALALWDSIPDQELRDAAAAGELSNPEQIAAQARRMLQDLRARHKVQGFFEHWLELDDRDLAKDPELFPEFDAAIVADLRRSLELFLEEVVWSDRSDYRELLSADHLLLNERLLAVYGPQLAGGKLPTPAVSPNAPDTAVSNSPEDAAGEAQSAADPLNGFRRVSFPPEERAGVMTHPYLLSVFAYHNNTSPIHRGVFVTRNIVGRALKPPPIAVAFKNDEFAADLTMREKITQLTRDTNCMACHSLINPLGFALEGYDAVGRWRTMENNRPVNTRSAYTTETGETVELSNARDIAQLALTSESAQRAFINQLFQHITKQNPPVYGPAVVEELRAEFAADGYHIGHVIERIAVLAAVAGQPANSEGG